MYRIALCDDNQDYLKFLKSKIQKYCEKKFKDVQIIHFNDSLLLRECIEEGNVFDAYFLDIEMPRYSGTDIARLIKKRDKQNCYIIFLTSYSIYAVEACGINVVRYILKECVNVELESALDELFKYLEEWKRDKFYVISNSRRYLRLSHRDIVYIYKNYRYAVFVMKDGREEKERISLRDAWRKLDDETMVFLDRCIILNISYVQRIGGNKITMEGGHEIYTSSEHEAELKKYLNGFWGKQL